MSGSAVAGKALSLTVVDRHRHNIGLGLYRLQQELRLTWVFKLQCCREVAACHLRHHSESVEQVLLEGPALVEQQQNRGRTQREADRAQHQAVEFGFDEVGWMHTNLLD